MTDEKSSGRGDDAPATTITDEAKLAALRAALIEGEDSGASLPFDVEAFIVEMRAARD